MLYINYHVTSLISLILSPKYKPKSSIVKIDICLKKNVFVL